MKKVIIYIVLTLVLMPFKIWSQSDEDLDYQLIIASEKGDSAKVMELLNKGTDVNAYTYDGVTPLMYACGNEHFMVAKILVANGANVNARPDNGITSLISTARNGNWKIGELLIQKGAKINEGDWYEASAILHATAYGFYNMVDMLLYYGADIENKDSYGTTSLMTAARYNQLDIAELLIEKGANINTTDEDGLTSLMIAAQYNDSSMVKLLLENGADTDVKDNNQMTAFTYAVWSGNKSICKILLEKGADINQTIGFSKNPVYFASKKKNKPLKKYLLQKGAKRNFAPSFDRFTVGTDFLFNNKDIFTGINIGLHEAKYDIDVGIGYDLRPWVRRVLIHRYEDEYYQYWEKRSVFYVTIDKRLNVYKSPADINHGLLIGIKNNVTNAKYLGSNIKPGADFITSPRVGIYRSNWFSSIMLNYELIDFNLYKFSKHWINLSLNLDFNIDKHSKSYKSISWY